MNFRINNIEVIICETDYGRNRLQLQWTLFNHESGDGLTGEFETGFVHGYDNYLLAYRLINEIRQSITNNNFNVNGNSI
jgi:hypothetical protein